MLRIFVFCCSESFQPNFNLFASSSTLDSLVFIAQLIHFCFSHPSSSSSFLKYKLRELEGVYFKNYVEEGRQKKTAAYARSSRNGKFHNKRIRCNFRKLQSLTKREMNANYYNACSHQENKNAHMYMQKLEKGVIMFTHVCAKKMNPKSPFKHLLKIYWT